MFGGHSGEGREVGEGMHGDTGFHKFFHGIGKPIGEQGYNAHDGCAGVLDTFYGLEATFSGRDEVFHEHNFIAWKHFAFHLVLESVFFGLRSHVAIGHVDFIGSQGPVGDACGGDACDAVGFGELGLDEGGQFFGHESAHFGVGKHHAVIAIDG